MSGMARSSTMASGRRCAMRANASRPLAAVSTSNPRKRSATSTARRRLGSSSTGCGALLHGVPLRCRLNLNQPAAAHPAGFPDSFRYRSRDWRCPIRDSHGDTTMKKQNTVILMLVLAVPPAWAARIPASAATGWRQAKARRMDKASLSAKGRPAGPARSTTAAKMDLSIANRVPEPWMAVASRWAQARWTERHWSPAMGGSKGWRRPAHAWEHPCQRCHRKRHGHGNRGGHRQRSGQRNGDGVLPGRRWPDPPQIGHRFGGRTGRGHRRWFRQGQGRRTRQRPGPWLWHQAALIARRAAPRSSDWGDHVAGCYPNVIT